MWREEHRFIMSKAYLLKNWRHYVRQKGRICYTYRRVIDFLNLIQEKRLLIYAPSIPRELSVSDGKYFIFLFPRGLGIIQWPVRTKTLRKKLTLSASLFQRSHDPEALEYFHGFFRWDVKKQDEVIWRQYNYWQDSGKPSGNDVIPSLWQHWNRRKFPKHSTNAKLIDPLKRGGGYSYALALTIEWENYPLNNCKLWIKIQNKQPQEDSSDWTKAGRICFPEYEDAYLSSKFNYYLFEVRM